jgi:hypothetical protein
LTKTISILFYVCLIFIANSCCTKKKCNSDSVYIDFYNFVETDLDTVIVCRYSKNSNFTILQDSIKEEAYLTYGATGTTPFSLALEKIDPNSDYKIYITSLGQVHKLTDFKTEIENCNSCFLVIPKDKYIQIKSYQLNGQTISGQTIKIYK